MVGARRWLTGLVVGLVSGTGSLVAGTLGAALGVCAILLVAARAPRSVAAGGVCIGLGLSWLVLLIRADMACDVDCVGPDLGAWYLVGGALLFVGVVLTARLIVAARATS